MLLHVDKRKFTEKPSGAEVAGIKARFTNSKYTCDLSAEEIADALTAGKTIQPGLTPFSETSRARGRKGTVKGDFSEQTLFMVDIDNKRTGVPIETPEHVVEVLKSHNLNAAFMYETFSSTEEVPHFRFALVSDEPFTDINERDRTQKALISLFPQADTDCVNADRIFYGTDKGLIEGVTDFSAVCGKEDLLALSAGNSSVNQTSTQVCQKAEWSKFGDTIPTGQRHGTLLSFACSILKRYGITDQSYTAFMERAAQCEEPKPQEELEKIWADACKFYEDKIVNSPGYIPPDQYAINEFDDDVDPIDRTDVGQAEVFARVYRNVVRYSPATKFLIYNGTVWQESEIKAQGLSQDLTDRQLNKAQQLIDEGESLSDLAGQVGDENMAKAANALISRGKDLRRYALARRKSDKVRATLTEARPKVEIDVKALDADPYLLNTPGGTVDLRTGEIKPNDPMDFCTKITTVAPDTENAELFAEFMERVTVGDADLARYLQEVAGMCAVGRVLRENLIIAYGGGGNGKSTLFNLLSHVLGDYSGSLSAETLTANCRKNKSPEFAELRGKRIIIAAELEEGMRLDTSIVKKLCSTDEIQAEKKYKDPFKFVPSHTVILYTNHLPKIGTTDKGTWDRIVAVPFNASFRGMKGEIKNYAEYLYEKCGGAVLSWIIEGAKRFIENGYDLVMPDCVKSAIDQYKVNNNWLDNFLDECCDIDPSYTQKSGELYECYRKYCERTAEYRRSLADFKQALSEAGYETQKTRTGAVVYGLRVSLEFSKIDDDDDKPPFSD